MTFILPLRGFIVVLAFRMASESMEQLVGSGSMHDDIVKRSIAFADLILSQYGMYSPEHISLYIEQKNYERPEIDFEHSIFAYIMALGGTVLSSVPGSLSRILCHGRDSCAVIINRELPSLHSDYTVPTTPADYLRRLLAAVYDNTHGKGQRWVISCEENLRNLDLRINESPWEPSLSSIRQGYILFLSEFKAVDDTLLNPSTSWPVYNAKIKIRNELQGFPFIAPRNELLNHLTPYGSTKDDATQLRLYCFCQMNIRLERESPHYQEEMFAKCVDYLETAATVKGWQRSMTISKEYEIARKLLGFARGDDGRAWWRRIASPFVHFVRAKYHSSSFLSHEVEKLWGDSYKIE